MAKAIIVLGTAATAAVLGAVPAHADSWPWDDPRDARFVEEVGGALGLDRVNGTKVAKYTVCDELKHGMATAEVVDQVARTLELTGEQARVFTNLAVQVYCADWRAVAPPPSQASKPVPAPAPRSGSPLPLPQEPEQHEYYGDEDFA